METVIPIMPFKLLEPGDWKAFLVTHRIPFAGKDDAYCRIILKLQIDNKYVTLIPGCLY